MDLDVAEQFMLAFGLEKPKPRRQEISGIHSNQFKVEQDEDGRYWLITPSVVNEVTIDAGTWIDNDSTVTINTDSTGTGGTNWVNTTNTNYDITSVTYVTDIDSGGTGDGAN